MDISIIGARNGCVLMASIVPLAPPTQIPTASGVPTSLQVKLVWTEASLYVAAASSSS